jgi:CRISPR-associated endoribonuclease Cas6
MIFFSINTFKCTLTDDAMLPPYKGSTFRGAFGVALKKVVCALRNKECSQCLLASRCIYAQIFEPTSWHSDSSRTVAPPHPYIIEPDPSSRTRYSSGDSFSFNLLLFGEFVKSLPYFIFAVETMGEVGIGQRTGNGRARFTIAEVSDETGAVVYNSATKRIVPSPQPRSLPEPEISDAAAGLLSLSLNTPLRFKNDNRFIDTLTFQDFTRAALRRVSSMHAAYGDGDPPLDYRGKVADAASVKTVVSTLTWHDWKRYSNRQHDEMLFGGMCGNISFVGNIGPFMQIIEQAKIMHIGKQSTFGLGKFNYIWEPEN